MANSVIEYTTGPSGTGKSYSRVSLFLITEFLPERTGRFFTNVNLGRVPDDHPFKPEPWTDTHGRTRTRTSFIRRICNEAAKRYGGHPNDYAKRVRRIPPSVCKGWRIWKTQEEQDRNSKKPGDGPWVYFNDMDLSASHIQIDEIHIYCPKDGSRKKPIEWMDWLGEIRHRGCTVEFMTQFIDKANPKIINEAGLRRVLTKTDIVRDPFFGIPVGSWLELRAKFLTGTYDVAISSTEKMRVVEGWQTMHAFKFRFKPEYFAFYNSHERPQKGGKAGKEDKKQFQLRTKKGLLWWFIKKYPGQLVSRFAVLGTMIWLCFLGGGPFLMTWFMTVFMVGLAGDQAQAQEQQPTPEIQHAEIVDDAQPTNALPIETDTTTPELVVPPVEPVDDPDPTPEQSDELQELRDQLAALQESRELLIQEKEQLAERRRAGTAVVMITPTEVTFRNGYSYALGEVIDYGEYEGSIITAINYSRRAVTIDENIILRMGRDDSLLDDDGVSVEADAGSNADRPPALREPLRADGPQQSEGGAD